MAEFEQQTSNSEIGASSMSSSLAPSNLEVKVRTLASDIESIGKGGGYGVSEKISISIPRGNEIAGGAVSTPQKGSRVLLYILLGVLGLGVLFAAGYFLPGLLSKPQAPAVNPPAAEPTLTTAQVPPVATTTAPAATTTPAKVGIPHNSYFGVPTDAILNFNFNAATPTSPKDQWSAALKTATATLTEAVPLVSGANLSWADFLSALDIQTASTDFFKTNFEQDFTAFVYKDKAGSWPGYVLKLKSGISPLFIRTDVIKMETDSALLQFVFANAPGSPATAFKDGQLSSQPVRELFYSGTPAAFIYGWFHNQYLIIGTSEDAVRAAVARL